MDFSFSEEHDLIRKSVREFAENVIRPTAAQRDAEQRFPEAEIQALADMGYFGMLVPEEDGGLGFDMMKYALVMEELSRVDAAVGVIISITNSLAASSLAAFGNPEQKAKYLQPMAAGEIIGAFALSEAGSGSDAVSLRTTALKDGDVYVMNGEKMWISSAERAGYFVVFARTNPDIPGSKGISAFIVEPGLDGFEVLPKEQKMGLRSSDTCPIRFENVRVPAQNRLGNEGEGFKIAMSLLDGGRIGIASQAVGIAQACLEESIKYAKVREQFGKPIAEFQAIQFKIAQMATKIEAARNLILKACTLKDQQKEVGPIASMAKWMASETAVWCAEQAIQIHGGNGYIKDYPVERYLRDAKVTEIYEGTSQIQQVVISRYFLRDTQ